MSSLLVELTGGDRRSIGRSNLIVRMVLDDRRRLAEIINGLSSEDYLVRMRCADVVEKVSLVHPGWLVHPDWLAPHRHTLFDLAAKSTMKELRWHLAQMLPRLDLSRPERNSAIAIMLTYLNDTSRIVRTFAMQALADLAGSDLTLHRKLLPLFEELAQTDSPAVRARARRLIRRLERGGSTKDRRRRSQP